MGTTISVDVSFYDDSERAKLLQYPTAKSMEALVANPVEIPTAEFLTYYFFHRLRIGSADYLNYETVGRLIENARASLVGCLEFTHSICATSSSGKQTLDITEHVGEAIGLSVVNRIHNLTEADWKPIPQQHGPRAKKSFDFEIASDGKQLVQMEAKGSFVADNRVEATTAAAHLKSIHAKKTQLRGRGLQALRYGTITVADGRPDGNVRCFLADPPGDELESDPRNVRVLNRIRNLQNWISFLSPNSAFAAALATRVAAIEALANPFDLADVPLFKGTGEPFPINTTGTHAAFMASKSRVIEAFVGGVVIQLSKEALFFIGIQEELLDLAATQNFQKIASYRVTPDSWPSTVLCNVSLGRFDKLLLPQSVQTRAQRLGGYVQFQLEGELHHSPGGLVFGELPLTNP